MTAKATSSAPTPPFTNPFAEREKKPSKKSSKKGSKVVAGVNTILQATKSGSLGHEQILIALEATAKAANGRSPSPEHKDNILRTASCDRVASRRVKRLSLPSTGTTDDIIPAHHHEAKSSTAPELSPSTSSTSPEQKQRMQLSLKIFALRESVLAKKNEIEEQVKKSEIIFSDIHRLEQRCARRRTEIDMRVDNYKQLERAFEDLAFTHSAEGDELKKELTAKIISLKEEVYNKRSEATELETRIKSMTRQAHVVQLRSSTLRTEVEQEKAEYRKHQKIVDKLPSSSPREPTSARDTNKQEELLQNLARIQKLIRGEVSDLVLRELRGHEHFALRELRDALEIELRSTGRKAKNLYDVELKEQEAAFSELIGKKSFDTWKAENFPKPNALPNP